jgi:HEAT repeat protein
MRDRQNLSSTKSFLRPLVTLSPCHIVILLMLACGGCGKKKSTDELFADLKSSDEKSRIIAVRLLPQHKEDAGQIVPVLIQVLKDKDADIRCGAAIGLGYFGDQAKDAIPALQAAQRDPDARIREAARVALSRIDPARFPTRSKARPARGK